MLVILAAIERALKQRGSRKSEPFLRLAYGFQPFKPAAQAAGMTMAAYEIPINDFAYSFASNVCRSAIDSPTPIA